MYEYQDVFSDGVQGIPEGSGAELATLIQTSFRETRDILRRAQTPENTGDLYQIELTLKNALEDTLTVLGTTYKDVAAPIIDGQIVEPSPAVEPAPETPTVDPVPAGQPAPVDPVVDPAPDAPADNEPAHEDGPQPAPADTEPATPADSETSDVTPQP